MTSPGGLGFRLATLSRPAALGLAGAAFALGLLVGGVAAVGLSATAALLATIAALIAGVAKQASP